MVRHCSLQKAVDDSTNEGEACSNDVHNFYHCMFLWNKFCSLGMRWQWYQQKLATLHLQCICPSFYMFKKIIAFPQSTWSHLKDWKEWVPESWPQWSSQKQTRSQVLHLSCLCVSARCPLHQPMPSQPYIVHIWCRTLEREHDMHY